MNKKQPYEEALERQMNNLPSEHEDESWQKMKQLLDYNEKREPFAYFKTYKLAIILIFLLLIGFWLVIRETNMTKEKPFAAVKINNRPKQKDQIKPEDQLTALQKNSTSGHSLNLPNNSKKHSNQQLPATLGKNKILQSKSVAVNKKGVYQRANNFSKKNEINQKNLLFLNHNNAATADIDDTKNRIISLQNNLINSNKPRPNLQQHNELNSLEDIQTIHPNPLTFQSHETFTRKEDSLAESSASVKQIISPWNKKYFLSAGIGVQQQIPLAGQKVVAYGYNAKNTLSDYIPSVYFRLQRERKWFLQAEFVYTAPQLIKEFSYSRQTLASDSNRTVTTTALNLKKAFFNKIPVTFNYYIRRNWSAGAGGMYSVFEGAIAEKEIATRSTQTTAQSVVKQIVPIAGYTDSFLYKSNMYLVVQSNYDRPRFSIGLRYTKGIQPYIRYTLPDGAITDKKNWALEFFVRFRLWKSAKF